MSESFQTSIATCVKILKEGGLILYPTDTVWGIGCDATNAAAVKKVYQLKKRPDSKALICLVGNNKMLETIISEIPPMAYTLMELSQKPLTLIYENPRKVAQNLIPEDHTLAIRIPDHKFCQALLKEFGRPIVSTSANLAGKPSPKSFHEIETAILSGVDYVVPLYQNTSTGKPSSILKLSGDGTVKVIRT